MDRSYIIEIIICLVLWSISLICSIGYYRKYLKEKKKRKHLESHQENLIKDFALEQDKVIEKAKVELNNIKVQTEKEKTELQCARRQREEETEREKDFLKRELSSYGNYLWEQEKKKIDERHKIYDADVSKMIDIYDTIKEGHRLDAEFAEIQAKDLIDSLRQEIDDYRAQCEAINEQIRQRELLENEKTSHTLQLSISEQEDIGRLLELSHTFNQPTIIYKLIWSAFLQKPFNDMINNLFGTRVPRNVIYCIENQKTNKKYIGKTSAEVSKRWAEHIKTSLGIGSVSAQKIHEALRGHWADFTFSIIEEVTKDNLSEREKFYIDFYQSNIYGYNLKKGG